MKLTDESVRMIMKHNLSPAHILRFNIIHGNERIFVKLIHNLMHPLHTRKCEEMGIVINVFRKLGPRSGIFTHNSRPTSATTEYANAVLSQAGRFVLIRQ